MYAKLTTSVLYDLSGVPHADRQSVPAEERAGARGVRPSQLHQTAVSPALLLYSVNQFEPRSYSFHWIARCSLSSMILRQRACNGLSSRLLLSLNNVKMLRDMMLILNKIVPQI